MMKINSDLIIITGEYLIVSARLPFVKNGAVVIKKRRVIDWGEDDEILKKYKGGHVIKRPNSIIAPGLINVHTHAPMVLFRGLADDLPLKTWLEKYIFPAEAKLNSQVIELGTWLSCAEMLASGTTTFVDMYFFERTMAKIVEKIGMRAYLGEGILDFPTPSFNDPKEVFKETEDLLKIYKGHPRINFTVCPHTPYTCQKELLIEAKNLSKALNLKLVIHLSETKWEYEEFLNKKGMTPVEYLNDLELLDRDLIAVHCVWLTDSDIELLAQKEVNVVHCPESNLKLGSGISPVKKMREKGINVCLGTDGAASNNDLDMLCEMDMAAKIAKGEGLDPAIISAEDVFFMATEAGAKALGRTDLGHLNRGASADLFIINLDRPHLRPCFNPISQIVYAAKAGDITDVMVDGNFLIKEGRFLTINIDDVIKKVKSFQHQPIWQESPCN